MGRSVVEISETAQILIGDSGHTIFIEFRTRESKGGWFAGMTTEPITYGDWTEAASFAIEPRQACELIELISLHLRSAII